jgi:hypothetical protein
MELMRLEIRMEQKWLAIRKASPLAIWKADWLLAIWKG